MTIRQPLHEKEKTKMAWIGVIVYSVVLLLCVLFIPAWDNGIIRCAEGSYNTTAICYTNPNQKLCVDTIYMCVEGVMVDQKTYVDHVLLRNN